MTLEGGYEDKHLQFSSIQNVDTGKTFNIFILYIIYSNKSKMVKQEEKEVREYFSDCCTSNTLP